MNQENNWWGNKNIAYLITTVSLLLIAALVLRKLTTASGVNFGLSFNIYSLLSFVSALVDVVIIILVLSKKRYSLTTNWFVMFVMAATLMALAEGLQRLSISPAAALFWQNGSYLFISLLPPTFYLFIVSYIYGSKKKFVLLSSILLLTWGVIAFFVGDNQLYFHAASQIQHARWGYFSQGGLSFDFTVIWCCVFYVFGTGLLLQFIKNNPSRIIRKQVLILIYAFLSPFLIAIITGVILPDVLPNVIPPLATLLGAFSAILTYYAIRHYQLFVLDPDLVAQNILGTLNEAVIITRPDMVIESVNAEAERMIDIDKNQFGHIKLSDYFDSGSWRIVSDHIVGSHGYKIAPINKSLITGHDKTRLPVRIAVTQHFEEDQVTAYIFVLADISALTKTLNDLEKSNTQIQTQNSALIKLESQLREEKANVEHIVEIRTRALVDAQKQLKAADELKSEFIMLTSHNLRTPIAIARGYLEALEGPLPGDAYAANVQALKAGLNRLKDLVEDLLTISSIESGDQFKMEDVTLEQIVNPLVEEAMELAKEKNNKLEVNLQDTDAKLKANTALLKGAFRNILNNACKFTENGVIGFNTSKIDNKIILTVSDTGIGMSPEQIPLLFNKFHRASSALTGSYEGQGVGLYLAKIILEEHHGKISVSSHVDKGSIFTIELPCLT